MGVKVASEKQHESYKHVLISLLYFLLYRFFDNKSDKTNIHNKIFFILTCYNDMCFVFLFWAAPLGVTRYTYIMDVPRRLVPVSRVSAVRIEMSNYIYINRYNRVR